MTPEGRKHFNKLSVLFLRAICGPAKQSWCQEIYLTKQFSKLYQNTLHCLFKKKYQLQECKLDFLNQNF